MKDIGCRNDCTPNESIFSLDSFRSIILNEQKPNLKRLYNSNSIYFATDLESVLTVLGGIKRIRQRGSSESEDGGTAPVHERSHELLVRSLGERSEPRHDNLLLVRGQVASDLCTFIFPKRSLPILTHQQSRSNPNPRQPQNRYHTCIVEATVVGGVGVGRKKTKEM